MYICVVIHPYNLKIHEVNQYIVQKQKSIRSWLGKMNRASLWGRLLLQKY